MRSPERHGASVDAIEAVYRERYRAFVRTTSAYLNDSDGGHDAVQAAFADALRSRHTYRGEGTVEAWIWKIVVTTARRQAARALLQTLPLGDEGSGSGDGGHAGDEAAALRARVSGLPERQRLVVFLRYFGDLDHAAIAEALDIRPGTVAATLHAAHAALRSTLQEVTSR